MKRIVISQPMFFPWVGLFEQIRIADMYVHYDDVQLPTGRSFMTRVQIKAAAGVRWLTAPVRRGATLISDTRFDESQGWRRAHLKSLQQEYARAAYVSEMLEIADAAYTLATDNLAAFNRAAIELVARYFGFECEFVASSELGIDGRSSERLLALTRHLGGSVYVTGHGARNYLDHELFEQAGVRVEYMDYQKVRYPQLHGDFTPFVSVLDLIANAGRPGRAVITSPSVYWKDFLKCAPQPN